MRETQIGPVLERHSKGAAAKFFENKLLPVSDCAPWITFRFPSNSMIPVDREGEGGGSVLIGNPPKIDLRFTSTKKKRPEGRFFLG